MHRGRASRRRPTRCRNGRDVAQAHVYDDDQLIVGDLAKAAFIRLAGPERFPALERAVNPRQPFPVEHVGMALAHFEPEDREALQAAIDRY